ncbi:MAG: recombination mediator RecR [Proteobacteria bacterium]|nr:recombination protein RecR [Luminiphilus sp.]MDA0651238.1 recombination mediator RecR [Pseudomonadota bacterium]
MKLSPSIEALIEGLRHLPGVGPKSAQRMTLHLLERDREGAQQIAEAIEAVLAKVKNCQQCRNFSELDVCEICSDSKRDSGLLCVVEAPVDVMAIEQSGSFKGHYYVLMGHLSPIDGIGPEQLGLDALCDRFATGTINEVILATNPTVEGEATAYYISERARDAAVTVSRIAHGVPLGGELEYTDASTLAHALSGRTVVRE